jgi:branched-chain amino acid transport system permease protein
VVIYLCVVGIVPIFGERPLVDEAVTLGEAALYHRPGVRVHRAQRAPAGPSRPSAAGCWPASSPERSWPCSSSSALLSALRSFSATSRRTFSTSSFPRSDPAINGFWMPLLGGAVLGLVGAILAVLPRVLRGLIVANLVALFAVGLFAGLIRTPMLSGLLANEARTVFASEGLTLTGALLTVVVVSAAYLAWVGLNVRQRVREMPDQQRRVASIPVSIVLLLFIVWLPLGMGPFVAQAVALIALYILMGLGLNITLGLAGLLDLGFVAFFAVGAYTVALLTSTGPFVIADIPFWFAVPFAIIAAMAFGIFLGLPILGIRGDYLAIATLGFGEIIAILAKSDLLKPWLGGPQGILNIPPPIAVAVTDFLNGPVQIYYIALVCAAVVAFVAYRLRGSRLGRAWLAIREDEDVAEALGVNLVQTKTLASPAAFCAGLGGPFAASSVFPSSQYLRVRNMAAIVIVGGMGSSRRVLGAIVLIGQLFMSSVPLPLLRHRPDADDALPPENLWACMGDEVPVLRRRPQLSPSTPPRRPVEPRLLRSAARPRLRRPAGGQRA